MICEQTQQKTFMNVFLYVKSRERFDHIVEEADTYIAEDFRLTKTYLLGLRILR